MLCLLEERRRQLSKALDQLEKTLGQKEETLGQLKKRHLQQGGTPFP
jgi:hypothetical protein